MKMENLETFLYANVILQEDGLEKDFRGVIERMKFMKFLKIATTKDENSKVDRMIIEKKDGSKVKVITTNGLAMMSISSKDASTEARKVSRFFAEVRSEEFKKLMEKEEFFKLLRNNVTKKEEEENGKQ